MFEVTHEIICTNDSHRFSQRWHCLPGSSVQKILDLVKQKYISWSNSITCFTCFFFFLWFFSFLFCFSFFFFFFSRLHLRFTTQTFSSINLEDIETAIKRCLTKTHFLQTTVLHYSCCPLVKNNGKCQWRT